jgi:2-phospho-L-lactate transferase/gluconeogenesis factor (CofD/UPF0052 family)
MSAPRPGFAVTLFTGGRGGASIARQLLRRPGIDLSLVINGYDNGLSTGALRRYLPGMLGPSDFRKNLLLHLDGGDPEQAALITVLRRRLPAGATRKDLDGFIDTLASPAGGPMPGPAGAAIARDLSAFRHRLHRHPHGLDLGGCALGNLVLAGAYLRLGGDFNGAVRSCARTFGSPARLLNITNGENAFLVALKQDGRLLADEADIVAPQDAAAITDLFLLREPLSPARRAELAGQPIAQLRHTLARHRAGVSLNPQAWRAIRRADLIVYGPGTPHSSLLPTYLTPGLEEAIGASRARARVFVVNISDDHDVTGMTAPELVERTLAYLGDPANQRSTITHVLHHRAAASPADLAGGDGGAGARWVTADLEDPERPGVHCGRRTVSALAGIAEETTLARLG